MSITKIPLPMNRIQNLNHDPINEVRYDLGFCLSLSNYSKSKAASMYNFYYSILM